MKQVMRLHTKTFHFVIAEKTISKKFCPMDYFRWLGKHEDSLLDMGTVSALFLVKLKIRSM